MTRKAWVPSTRPPIVIRSVSAVWVLCAVHAAPGALEARTNDWISPSTSGAQTTWTAEHRLSTVMSTVPGSTIGSGATTMGSSAVGSSTVGSSSSVVTITSSTSETESNSSAEVAASTTDKTSVDVTSPSSGVSSSPVTVSVWATSQLSAVNVATAGATVASDGSETAALTTTVPVGSIESANSIMPAVPASETTIGVPATVKLGGVRATATSVSSREQSGLYRATKPSERPSDENRPVSALGSKSAKLLK